jgi:hypothetical protein
MKISIAAVLAAVTFACSASVHAQSSIIAWSALDAGVAVAGTGNSYVTSVLGQSFTGASSTGNSGIRSGFLAYPFLPAVSSGVQAAGDQGTPKQYELRQNYPNPFNPSTTIQFALPHASGVLLTVYNVLGQEVARLVDEVRPAGYHTVVWNGKNGAGSSVSSGVYFFRISAQDVNGSGNFSQLKKMILLK